MCRRYSQLVSAASRRRELRHSEHEHEDMHGTQQQIAQPARNERDAFVSDKQDSTPNVAKFS
jgi:hypothetical protein